jgi:hypothetical protein
MSDNKDLGTNVKCYHSRLQCIKLNWSPFNVLIKHRQYSSQYQLFGVNETKRDE